MMRLLKKSFWSVIGCWRMGRWVESQLRQTRQLLAEMQKAPKGMPWNKRYWAVRHGFYCDRVTLYGLTPENIDKYVPDITFEALHPHNGRFSSLIDGKFQLWFTLRDYREYLPKIHYLIRKGVAFDIADELPRCRRYDPILVSDLLKKQGKLILKPEGGECGDGVHLLEKTSEGWRLDGRDSSESAVLNLLASLQDHLVTEYVEQHPYARQLFPNSANTIRFVTIRRDDTLLPYVAATYHRIGTHQSQPVDNSACGGIYGLIDENTGILGKFTRYPSTTELEWSTKHPDTGAQMTGIMIPRWAETKKKIMEISASLPFIEIMGFDVVITENGFKILEINSLPSISWQVFGPMGAKPVVAEFFQKRVPRAC